MAPGPHAVGVEPTPLRRPGSAGQRPRPARRRRCGWCARRSAGASGPRSASIAEYPVIAAAARRLGRPVRWVETRSESMISMVAWPGPDPGRRDRRQVRRHDRRPAGLDIIADVGAYPAIGVAILRCFTRNMSAGVYRHPQDRRAGDDGGDQHHHRRRLPGSRPAGGRRPGRAGHGHGGRRARPRPRRGSAPANLIPPFDDPAHHRHRLHLRRRRLRPGPRRGRPPGRLRGAPGRAEARRERGDRLALGIGVSVYVEITGGRARRPSSGRSRSMPTGPSPPRSAPSPHGQGHETAFAQIVSATLGVPMEAVRLVHSDTAAVPEGQGTYGSRSLQLGGSSIFAGRRGRARAWPRQRAANLLEANPGRRRPLRRRPGRRGRHPGPVPRLGRSWPPAATSRSGPRPSTSRGPTPTRSAPTSPWSRSTPRPAP